ncbi:YLP motif-containing protein 1-like isoform X2 [Coccinella septempunctata]|uniref:YLP motif-containing protein 1-like isoform X2 n=1 Tax=Coccinella septempunctata TaxID=41139 RepID=UPI001D069B0E|nr:YLP motif-containing protein 1-like isoform X2 [Coccinella septempunctata]
MSWAQWPGTPTQQPPVVAATAPLLNTAPAVIPPGMPYTSDQWTQMQQQNWQQWAQWQQQYQQWHQQYGAEYQKSINALAAQQSVVPNIGGPPPLPVDPQPQPPLPKEELPKPAPPLPVPVPPPQHSVVPQYSTTLMPNQFSAPPPSFVPNPPQQPWKASGNVNVDQKRQLPGKEDTNPKRQMTNRQGWQNVGATQSNPNQNEELSEAEKKFDKQFAEWEAQFNKWKEQNSGHPDKQQYKEYEKKWEQWRQQLLDRREAMRRKRLGLPPAKPSQVQNFNVPPPSQGVQQQPTTTASQVQVPPKDAVQPAASIYSKPPPDMNNEPLQFKGNDKEPEPQDGGGLGFLNTTKSDGIPGLDLVKDGDVEKLDDEEQIPVKKGPDLEAISKGINNILGDQKLMSMLSMVSQNQSTNLIGTPRIGADASSSRDQSNMSGDDARNEHPEPIQNFDDQTRSSFTMQPNDPEYYRGPPSNAQIGRGAPPPNFYDNESPYNRPPPNFTMPSHDDMKRPPPNRFGNEFDKGSFPNQNAAASDNAPPLVPEGLGRRGTGLLPDPIRKGNFGEIMTKGREPFGPGRARGDFGDKDINRGNFGPRGPDFEQDGHNKNLGGRTPFGRDLQGRNNFGKPYGFDDEGKGPLDNERNGRPFQNQRFAPGFREGRDDLNEPPPPNFRGGRDGLNQPITPNFRGGNRDSFNEHPPPNFRGGRDDFSGPPPPNFRGGRDDFNDRPPPNFRGDREEFNEPPPPNFRGGRDNLNEPPPPNFRGGRDDFNEPLSKNFMGDRDDFTEAPPPNFRGGRDNFNGPPPKNFRGGRGDFNEPPPANFRGGRDDFNKPPPPNFRGGRDDFNDHPPPNFKDGRDDFNEGLAPNFRGGRDDFNEAPPPRFRGGRGDFNEAPPPNFRGGRDDFNGPPSSNFNGRNNDFRQNDRPLQRGGNFGPGPDRYADERSPLNKGAEGFNERFNRPGGRFGGDMDPNYGEGDFADDGDYPPPPEIDGSFGRGENTGQFAEAPEPPQFGDEPLGDMPPEGDEQEPILDDDIWKPVTVVDYDHKRVKPPEIDVLVQPFRMYDYRHKTLRRIPYPERPNWLSDAVKMIPELDPPIIRPPPIDRRMYDDRYEPVVPRRDDRYRPDDRYKYERNVFDSRLSPPPMKFEMENDWPGRRRRSRSPPRFDRSQMYADREAWDQGGRPGERDRRLGNRRDREFDRERRDDRRERRDDRDRKEDDSWNRRDSGWEDKRRRIEDMEVDDVDGDKRDARFKADNKNIERDNYARKEGMPIFPFSKPIDENKPSNVTPIEDLLNAPGRSSRPQRIVIILRGPPGSGKTHLAKMIKDKEVENGGSAPRILSLDDYFMVEQEKEVVEDGKRVKLKEMVYEFEAGMEESYRNSLVKSFKKTITDGYFPFIIVDNVNDKVKYFGEMWSFAKQNGFQVYICQMELDVQNCFKRNIHNRTEEEIRRCIEGWETTPSHHPILDASSLLQGGPIPEVEMEEINSPISDVDDKEDGLEHDLMASANPPAPQELWRNSYSSTMSGKSPGQPNQERRGFGGLTWRNVNNRRR